MTLYNCMTQMTNKKRCYDPNPIRIQLYLDSDSVLPLRNTLRGYPGLKCRHCRHCRHTLRTPHRSSGGIPSDDTHTRPTPCAGRHCRRKEGPGKIIMRQGARRVDVGTHYQETQQRLLHVAHEPMGEPMTVRFHQQRKPEMYIPMYGIFMKHTYMYLYLYQYTLTDCSQGYQVGSLGHMASAPPLHVY
jgi:hypothetical protein